MTTETRIAYSALYSRLEAIDDEKAAASAIGHVGFAAHGAVPDPGGFREALDGLIPKVQAEFTASRHAGDFDEAERLEGVLTRLYFWRIFARDKLIATIDNTGTDEAMAALTAAAKRLEKTKQAFDQGDHDTATAMTSLDDLAKALSLKS